jgi:hypothetical protein
MFSHLLFLQLFLLQNQLCNLHFFFANTGVVAMVIDTANSIASTIGMLYDSLFISAFSDIPK